MRHLWVAGVLVACAVVILALWQWQRTRNAAAPPPYELRAVDRGDIEETVLTTGTLQPVLTVTVGSQVSGLVLQVYVDYNSQVRKNQLLARVDPQTLQTQRHQNLADLENVRHARETAEANVANARAGIETAQADVAVATAGVASTQSSVLAAQAQYRAGAASTCPPGGAGSRVRQRWLDAPGSGHDGSVNQAGKGCNVNVFYRIAQSG
ncbi:MAG: efflux RND transporter periplasmic adaptor subunit [Candidatus Xenobia bacterium]